MATSPPPEGRAPSPRALLPRTWAAFLARHGRPTPAQAAALAPVLADRDVALVAPTATGKTEALLAPVLERALAAAEATGARIRPTIYVSPTRALAQDMARRLQEPLHDLGLSLGVRTGDRHGVQTRGDLPALSIVTPETLDALIARNPAAFPEVGALILDEIHLIHGTLRGDQARALVVRLRRLVGSGDLRCHLLSATLRDPARVAEVYTPGAQVIVVEGRRAIDPHDVAWDDAQGPSDLAAALKEQGIRRALAFANTRREAEALAAALKGAWAWGDRVFLHYAGLDRRAREASEAEMCSGRPGIVVATSTLEIGVDVGEVEAVILFGPPPSVQAYVQRAGRGGRRAARVRVLRVVRDAAEQGSFDVLHRRAAFGQVEPALVLPLHPAVAAQQIASLLLQRQRIETSRAVLARLLEPLGVEQEGLEGLVDAMLAAEALEEPRVDRLRLGPALARAVTRGEVHALLGSERGAVEVVDADDGRVVGTIPATAERFVLGGRTWSRVRGGAGRIVARAVRGGTGEGSVARGCGRAAAEISLLRLRDEKVARFRVDAFDLPFAWDPADRVLTLHHYLGRAQVDLVAAALASRVPGGERVREDDATLCLTCPADPSAALADTLLFPGGLGAAQEAAQGLPEGRAWRDAGPFGAWVPADLRAGYAQARLTALFETWEWSKIRLRPQ